MQTQKQLIEDLPEGERSARRAMYSDEEWDRLWELNAFPHQLPPPGDWVSWTVLGGGGTGKTQAGLEWIKDKLLHPERNDRVVSIHHYTRTIDDILRALWWNTFRDVGGWEYTDSPDRTTRSMRNPSINVRLDMIPDSEDYWRGLDARYVWADDVDDAALIRSHFPRAEQFCFTQPTRLDPITIVTRA